MSTRKTPGAMGVLDFVHTGTGKQPAGQVGNVDSGDDVVVSSCKIAADDTRDSVTATWKPSSGALPGKEADSGEQPKKWEQTVRQDNVADDGRAARNRDNAADSMPRSPVQTLPNVKRTAGDLRNGDPNADPSSPSNPKISAHSVHTPWIVPGGQSMPNYGHFQGIESNNDCDTRSISARFADPRTDLMPHSMVGDGAAFSAGLFGKTSSDSAGDEAVEREKYRPDDSVVTGAPLVPGAARVATVIVNPHVSSPRQPTVAAFARANRDSYDTMKPRTVLSEERLPTEMSGGSELKVDPDADKGLVFDDPETCILPPRDRDMRDTCGSEDKQDSDASPDEDSSEDEEFNSSVKTDRYGFFITSERRKLGVPLELLRSRRLKENKRADKWRTMIDSFDDWRRGKKAKRLRNRVRKGVPDCVRGKVWQMLSGSTSMMEREPHKYAELVASDLPVEGPIEEDIPRTMYDHELFCRKSRVNGRDMLRRVLTAYGRYDRQVQYCQGMNYICSLFLLYMPEENAFWMLVASMNRPRAPLRELFLPGMIKAQEFQFVMDSLTQKHCAKLSNQILANNLTPAMYATQWFLTAFTQRFPYDLVTRVWDIFLLEDWKVFYRVCLALFKSVERKACTLDLENMNMLLRNMPPTVDAQEILDIAASIPLKHRHIEKRTSLFYDDRARENRTPRRSDGTA